MGSAATYVHWAVMDALFMSAWSSQFNDFQAQFRHMFKTFTPLSTSMKTEKVKVAWNWKKQQGQQNAMHGLCPLGSGI